jgi:hypothetical protein
MGISSRAHGLIRSVSARKSVRSTGSGLALSVVFALGFVTPSSFAQTTSFDLKDLTQQEKKGFEQRFAQENKTVLKFLDKTKFASPFTGDIKVTVFDYSPPISMALIPAWHGQRGQMKFAASRVKDKHAAVLHELTHVHAPNQTRYLAEGFAVYLEETLGSKDTFPTAGQSSECAMLRDPKAISSVNLETFDKVSLGSNAELGPKGAELGAQVGLDKVIPDEAEREAYSYLVSASFVKFLIRSYGLRKFKALYDTTPMTPGVVTPIDLDRYQPIYGKPLAKLQEEWLPWLKAKQRSCRGEK